MAGTGPTAAARRPAAAVDTPETVARLSHSGGSLAQGASWREAHLSRATRLAVLALLVVALCLVEGGLRLGARSPDTRSTLPAYSLGYFWDTPLGWTGVLDGTPINRDSSQFASLAAFLRGDADLFIPLNENVYTRFTGYALLGGALAPFLGVYLGFVACNVALWIAAALATYALAVRRTGSAWVGTLAAILVATAPAFGALAGQALPYVASYSFFAIGLWYCDRVGLFDGGVPAATAGLAGLAVGATLLVYDLYMLPVFVILYGLGRMPARRLGLFLVAAVAPKVLWAAYWFAAGLPRYTQNDSHPLEALQAWLTLAGRGLGAHQALAVGALAAHIGLNVLAAFMVVPVLLAAWSLMRWRRVPDVRWYLAVLAGGFAPAAFMVSTWPHIPRWYAYGFPAVYILAALAAVRIGGCWRGAPAWVRPVVSAAIVLLCVLLANLDLVGVTKPMELFLFQPQSWPYLWQR